MQFVKSTFVFLAAFIITLIVVDLFISRAEIENSGLNELDTIVGRKRIPNMKYAMFTEGFSLGEFNAYSYMGPGYPYEKAENIKRIAILGDSYVEGFQIFDRLHFRRIIETKLNQSLSDSIQVLNFGRSGFDMANMYVYYQRFVKKFNPDITLFLISNKDLKCNQTNKMIPKIVSDGNSFEIQNQYTEKSEKEFSTILYNNLKSSRILIMVNNCRKLIKQGFLYPKLFDKLYIAKEDSSKSLKAQSKPELNKIAININEALAKNSEEIFWIVNRGIKELNSDYLFNLKLNNIPSIDLNDTLDIIISKGVEINYWKATKKYGHWNHDAHIAIGDYLANKLLEDLSFSNNNNSEE